MGRKLTKEEFIKKVKEKNSHVRNGEIEIRGEFLGTKKRIECFCTIHNVTWSPIAKYLYKGIGCEQCRIEASANKHRTDANAIHIKLQQMKNGITMIGESWGMRVKTDFQCNLGHIWSAKPSTVLRGHGCPYCSGVRVWVGFNDLWTTRPDIAEMLLNPDDGYRYSCGSSAKLEFICKNCKSIVNQNVGDVGRRGLRCPFCSDGISYPNKFGRALLKQLNINNVQYEYSPDWLRPYFYDNYFEYLGKAYVLEMDGGIGHGNKKYGSKENDIIGKERDIYKDHLALEHGVHIIRIDCDYGVDINKRFEYIKNNILQSELSNIFDLSCIDWDTCDRQAQKTLVKQVADLYNQGLCVLEIQNIVGYHTETIRRWLKTATKYNLCNYNRNDSRRRTENFLHCDKINNGKIPI